MEKVERHKLNKLLIAFNKIFLSLFSTVENYKIFFEEDATHKTSIKIKIISITNIEMYMHIIRWSTRQNNEPKTTKN